MEFKDIFLWGFLAAVTMLLCLLWARTYARRMIRGAKLISKETFYWLPTPVICAVGFWGFILYYLSRT